MYEVTYPYGSGTVIAYFRYIADATECALVNGGYYCWIG